MRRQDDKPNAICMNSGCDFHHLICIQHKEENKKHPHTVRSDNFLKEIHQKYPQLNDKATATASMETMPLISSAPHLNEIKKKTNRTMPSKYHSNYLARESGCIRPNSSATKNTLRSTSTQDASQQSQSQLPLLQRQDAPHSGHSLSVGGQQPATACPPRRPRQERPSHTSPRCLESVDYTDRGLVWK